MARGKNVTRDSCSVKRLRGDAAGSRGRQAPTVAQESQGEGRADRDCGLRPEMFRFGPAAWGMCRAHPNEARVLMHHAAGSKRKIFLARPPGACTRAVVSVKRGWHLSLADFVGAGPRACPSDVRPARGCLGPKRATTGGCPYRPEICTDTAGAAGHYCVDSSGGWM
jgi:hypothetical protein